MADQRIRLSSKSKRRSNSDQTMIKTQQLTSQNADLEQRSRNVPQLDGAAETLISLRIVVLETDLQFNSFQEVSLLLGGLFEHVVHALEQRVLRDLRVDDHFGWLLTVAGGSNEERMSSEGCRVDAADCRRFVDGPSGERGKRIEIRTSTRTLWQPKLTEIRFKWPGEQEN